MARIAAWTMLAVGLALRIGDLAFQWIVHSPWSGRRSYPWGFFEVVVLWVEVFTMIPFLGAWLLAEARVKGGGVIRWRWWLGAILVTPVVLNLWTFAAGLSGEYSGQALGYALADCLPIWPIWYLVTSRSRQFPFRS